MSEEFKNQSLLRVFDHLVDSASDNPARLGAAIEYATSLEGLLQTTPQRRALRGVAARRTTLAERLDSASDEWSHAQHIAMSAAIERLLDEGRADEAVGCARALVDRAAAAATRGKQYPEAAYDRAQAEFSLGRTSRNTSRPEPALEAIERARVAFEGLASPGNENAALMASTCLTEGGDCQRDMGRYDLAAGRYETAIKAKVRLGDDRGSAVARSQLATVKMLQGDLVSAIKGWREAKDTFDALDEPKMVATACHQIGMVLQRAGRYEDSEAAYKESLALEQARGDRLGAASTFSQLAIVAGLAGHLEESVGWERRSLEIEVDMGRRSGEATSRNNLADSLRRLGRLGEAEDQARQAVTIAEDLGIGGTPWKTWSILHDIAVDRGDAAVDAVELERLLDSNWP